jgi:uncharacterized protein
LRILLIVISILFSLTAAGQNFPEPKNPPSFVNDFAKVLTPQEISALENKLINYFDSTSTEIAIVIIRSLNGYPIDDYSIQLAQRWGIGGKKNSNGILIFVSLEDRQVFIPVGYGMEGVLTDTQAKRIIENILKPNFRKGEYYSGLDKSIDSIISHAAGEYKVDKSNISSSDNYYPFLIIFSLFIIYLLVKIYTVRSYAIVNSIPFWTAWSLLDQANRPHRGTWDTFAGGGNTRGVFSGGGGMRSGSSGGFGGFGGGSFGGGGAGGSW